MPEKTYRAEFRGHSAEIRALELDGVRVALYRYAETGQAFVSINTEDATFDNAPDGNPTIFVELNDAVLYDGDENEDTRTLAQQPRPDIAQLASLARTALDDPAGLPESEWAVASNALRSGLGAGNGLTAYAIAKLDEIINALDPES